MKLEFADDLKSVIEGQSELEVPVDWVTKPEALSRYLNRGFGNAYDFDQRPYADGNFSCWQCAYQAITKKCTDLSSDFLLCDYIQSPLDLNPN